MSKVAILERAKNHCDNHQYRFTDPRRQVLEVLLSHPDAVGAYDIIKSLSTKEHPVKPPTVYRAIEFWIQQGFVHKIESINAYIACCHHDSHQHSLIMICDDCHEVNEVALDQLPSSIKDTLRSYQFTLKKSVMEITGYCKTCCQ